MSPRRGPASPTAVLRARAAVGTSPGAGREIRCRRREPTRMTRIRWTGQIRGSGANRTDSDRALRSDEMRATGGLPGPRPSPAPPFGRFLREAARFGCRAQAGQCIPGRFRGQGSLQLGEAARFGRRWCWVQAGRAAAAAASSSEGRGRCSVGGPGPGCTSILVFNLTCRTLTPTDSDPEGGTLRSCAVMARTGTAVMGVSLRTRPGAPGTGFRPRPLRAGRDSEP